MKNNQLISDFGADALKASIALLSAQNQEAARIFAEQSERAHAHATLFLKAVDEAAERALLVMAEAIKKDHMAARAIYLATTSVQAAAFVGLTGEMSRRTNEAGKMLEYFSKVTTVPEVSVG